MTYSASNLYAFYDHLTSHIIPGPRSISYFAFLLLLPGALLIPPTILSHRQLASVFLPLILACEMHTWYASAALDVISTTVLQWSFVLLVCYDPREDFRRVWWEEVHLPDSLQKHRKVRLVQREQVYPSQAVMERIAWVFTLLISIRLTGFKIRDKSHDKKQPTPRNMSRTAFLKHALSTILLGYVLLDISTYYTRIDPYFTTSSSGVDAPLPFNAPQQSLLWGFRDTLHYLPPRLVRSAILAAQLYGIIAGGFYPFAIPVVGLSALGIIPDEWSPHTWPRFFGAFSAISARGMRGLWGSWWHQMNRQINATPGRLLSNYMGFNRDSISDKMTVTTVAFGLSGWMHMGLIPPNPISEKMSSSEMRLSVAAFFWVQPLAFAIEYLVAMVWQRMAPRAKRWLASDLLVLLWVSTWLCLTLPMLTAPFRELGYWRVYPIPFSILNSLVGRGLWTWSRSTVET